MPQYAPVRVLRIDLDTRTSRVEELSPDLRARFIGGRGLGAAILYDEIRPGIDPLGPENVLVFATGPLTATAAPGSSKHVVLTKSPLTGIYLMSISSRGFGPAIRRAGYDAMVVTGVAAAPVYLVVDDDQVAFRDADHLWGLGTSWTEQLVKSEVGRDFSVSVIGPAGENLVPYAAILNDDGRAAGRGGAGAVMGSKRLKAIAVRGNTRVAVADPRGFARRVGAANREVLDLGERPRQRSYPRGTTLLLKQLGTLMTITSMNDSGILPVRNWQYTAEAQANGLDGYAMQRDHFVRNRNCPPCPVYCTKVCAVKSGPHAGWTSEGPEYETAYSLGSACAIYDLGAVIRADYLCDQYGLDTMSAGVTISFAMEAYERGLIPATELAGRELRFGDHTLLPDLIADIAYRRGAGRLISQGTRAMAAAIGGGAEHFAMHAKGMELGGYDPRGVKGMALVYACGPRGGCHHAGGRTIAFEVYTDADRFADVGKGALTRFSREIRVVSDLAILCNFEGFSEETVSELVSLATGVPLSSAELLTAAERTSNLERLFNVREGIRRNDDTLPARLLREPMPSGPAAGHVVNLDVLLDDFYAACGWDPVTGMPMAATLTRLGLSEYAVR